jgi:hypothetical protein
MTKAEIEAERKVADWYASPAGRRHVERVMDKGIRDGTAILVDGSKVNLTPAKIEALLQEARDKSTQAVSLRIPRADLDAAKRIAAKKRIGYQTVLKQAIHAGVREMS